MKPGHRLLLGKWVFKVKRDINNIITRFKAWRVVRGYLQQFVINFNQTFVAVVKLIVFRVLFTIAGYYNLDIDQIDIKTAFFYSLINDLVYVQISKGSKIIAIKKMVYKLLKTFYDLKQALRHQYKRLAQFLIDKIGLYYITANHNIFVTTASIKSPIVSIFMDEIKTIEV